MPESSSLDIAWGRERGAGRIKKGHKEILGDMFIIFIVAVLSQTHTIVKTYKIVHSKYTLFIEHIYISIRLFLKERKK